MIHDRMLRFNKSYLESEGRTQPVYVRGVTSSKSSDYTSGAPQESIHLRMKEGGCPCEVLKKNGTENKLKEIELKFLAPFDSSRRAHHIGNIERQNCQSYACTKIGQKCHPG